MRQVLDDDVEVVEVDEEVFEGGGSVVWGRGSREVEEYFEIYEVVFSPTELRLTEKFRSIRNSDHESEMAGPYADFNAVLLRHTT